MNPIDPQTHIRILLKNEFQKIRLKNKSYSIRSFGQKLGIDQSLLSKLMQGQRNISIANIRKISVALGVPLSPTFPAAASSLAQLEDEMFCVLGDWTHFAILELIKTECFVFDISQIAERLQISGARARDAFERLQRVGFVKVKDKKVILLKPSNTWLNEQKTSVARKAYQKNILELAEKSVDETPFEKRDVSSLTIAIDPADLEIVREKIKLFRRELDAFLETRKKKNEVYQLSIAFFPLTKEIQKQRGVK